VTPHSEGEVDAAYLEVSGSILQVADPNLQALNLSQRLPLATLQKTSKGLAAGESNSLRQVNINSTMCLAG
jgi:hypothetical protein